MPLSLAAYSQAINPLEMVMEAVALVQKRFYEDYPPHPKEKEYNYKCSSTMKPTQMKVEPPATCAFFSSACKESGRFTEASCRPFNTRMS